MNVKYMILSDARDTLETIFGGMSVKAFQNYYAADTLLKRASISLWLNVRDLLVAAVQSRVFG